MLRKILPIEIYNIIETSYNFDFLYELRLRVNRPICVNIANKYNELVDFNTGKTLYADKKLIDYVILKATDMSLYSYTEQIKQGFITMEGGIRIGLSGEVVYDANKEIKTIKNFFGLNIRIPHEILNCASTALRYILDNNDIKNTLILSAPGNGKTTLVRDIARQLGSLPTIKNILVVDERYEISGMTNGRMCLNIGQHTDVICGSTKAFAFDEGIRSMRPDVIITDELCSESDITSVTNAIFSGVKVIATMHAKTFEDMHNKKILQEVLKQSCFDRYILLSNRNGVGTYESVLDENFNRIVL